MMMFIAVIVDHPIEPLGGRRHHALQLPGFHGDSVLTMATAGAGPADLGSFPCSRSSCGCTMRSFDAAFDGEISLLSSAAGIGSNWLTSWGTTVESTIT